MDTIELVIPTAKHETDATAFAKEVMQADGEGIHGSSKLYTTDTYALWLENITRNALGETLPNLFPADTYFAMRVCDEQIVGIINIRHTLDSDFMRNYGGHIGYTVRPNERRKGYATQMLRLALERCKERNINRVLITCDPANTASYRVIEACSGVLENEIPYPDTNEFVRRYWITVL